MPFQLHEPFPSLSSSRPTYMHTGRGGAGNLHKTTATDVAARNPNTSTFSSSASSGSSNSQRRNGSLSSSKSATNTFLAGRGGAGNAHPLSERALFSFDEELERQDQMEREAAPIYHVGRGGAGNLVSGRAGSSSASSRASSRKDSSSSDGSELGGAGRRSLEWMKKLGRGSEDRRL